MGPGTVGGKWGEGDSAMRGQLHQGASLLCPPPPSLRCKGVAEARCTTWRMRCLPRPCPQAPLPSSMSCNLSIIQVLGNDCLLGFLQPAHTASCLPLGLPPPPPEPFQQDKHVPALHRWSGARHLAHCRLEALHACSSRTNCTLLTCIIPLSIPHLPTGGAACLQLADVERRLAQGHQGGSWSAARSFYRCAAEQLLQRMGELQHELGPLSDPSIAEKVHAKARAEVYRELAPLQASFTRLMAGWGLFEYELR